MEKNSEAFNRALSRMTYEHAGKRAIRHLHDSGLSPEDIEKALTYPRPLEVIKREIELYESEKASKDSSDFVQEQDGYGRITYRKVFQSGS